jgi:hypothetical protein
MKSKLPLTRNRALQKNKVYTNSNYQMALQLYYIYKIEAKAKKEPRLPIKDWRRPILKPKPHSPLLKYLRQEIFVHVVSLRKALGSFLHYTVPFVPKN